MDRFKEGFKYDISSQLIIHKFKSIEGLVEKAINVEKNNREKSLSILKDTHPLVHLGGTKINESIITIKNKPIGRLTQGTTK